jgi:hypothetical protein
VEHGYILTEPELRRSIGIGPLECSSL